MNIICLTLLISAIVHPIGDAVEITPDTIIAPATSPVVIGAEVGDFVFSSYEGTLDYNTDSLPAWEVALAARVHTTTCYAMAHTCSVTEPTIDRVHALDTDYGYKYLSYVEKCPTRNYPHLCATSVSYLELFLYLLLCIISGGTMCYAGHVLFYSTHKVKMVTMCSINGCNNTFRHICVFCGKEFCSQHTQEFRYDSGMTGFSCMRCHQKEIQNESN